MSVTEWQICICSLVPRNFIRAKTVYVRTKKKLCGAICNTVNNKSTYLQPCLRVVSFLEIVMLDEVRFDAGRFLCGV